MRQIFRTFSITITVVAGSAVASNAQTVSVLERVLGTIDNAANLETVNGVYANIAESIGTVPVPYEVVTPEQTVLAPEVTPEETEVFRVWLNSTAGEEVVGTVTLDQVGTGPIELQSAAGTVTLSVDEDLNITIIDAVDENGLAVYPLALVATETTAIRHEAGFDTAIGPGDTFNLFSEAAVLRTFPGLDPAVAGEWAIQVLDGRLDRIVVRGEVDPEIWEGVGVVTQDEAYVTIPELRETFYYYNPETIDGSINNTVTGVVEATALATASLATATEFTMPTMDFGDMATTALGAVNTGDITLGVNSAVDEAQTSTTAAISAAMEQIGGSVDTGAIVINVASNANAINGSINNVLNQVNGSIGNLSTTALGAVNTGTIVSGVAAAVQGIVGMSGQ
ncbi:hypothetical protein [Nioella sp.]|uniref:hypothetical protein n=1 Tax=Nioella sp. TaxID=1912091 RepID=UPI003A878BB9